jgi:hypothetical protein
MLMPMWWSQVWLSTKTKPNKGLTRNHKTQKCEEGDKKKHENQNRRRRPTPPATFLGFIWIIFFLGTPLYLF